ncbi:unnamed protein product [Urochloa humidicola]
MDQIFSENKWNKFIEMDRVRKFIEAQKCSTGRRQNSYFMRFQTCNSRPSWRYNKGIWVPKTIALQLVLSQQQKLHGSMRAP